MEQWASQHHLLILTVIAFIIIFVIGVSTWWLIQKSQVLITKTFLASLNSIQQSIDSIASSVAQRLEHIKSVPSGSSFPSGMSERLIDEMSDGLVKRLSFIESNFKKESESTQELINKLLMKVDGLNSTQRDITLSDPMPKKDVPYQYDVFLSYSSRDGELAKELCEALEAAGAKTFLAVKNLNPGEDFAEKIKKALYESCAVWLLVSPSSLKSDWVVSEWGAAWAFDKKIVPLLYRCDLENLPDRIRRVECWDFHRFPELIKNTFQNGKNII